VDQNGYVWTPASVSTSATGQARRPEDVRMIREYKPKILVAMPFLPEPPTIAQRHFELVSRLAQSCAITLFGGIREGGDLYQIQVLQDRGVDVHAYKLRQGRAVHRLGKRYTWIGKLQPTRTAFGSTKPGLILAQDQAMTDGAAPLQRLVDGGGFDVVHVEDTLVHWLPVASMAMPLAVEFDDINSVFANREALLKCSRYGRLLGRVNAYKQRRYDRVAAAAADICVTASEVDSLFLQRVLPGARTHEVPNGVDTEYFRPWPHLAPDPATLLFVGTMHYGPNADAACYFVRSIWPLIRRVYPEVRLQIVGVSPPPDVVALAADANIDVLGTVHDVRPYFAQATVVVVPLRYGSGTRLKILQALAMEKAVVSTTVGAEGLHLFPSEIVQADTPRAFATAVIELLVESAKRKQLGEVGRSAVVARYDWNAAAAKLYEIYSTFAGQLRS